MNNLIRQKASEQNIPLMDYILGRIRHLEKSTGVRRTIFAACPNSMAVLRAAIRSAKRNNSPVKFAATLNQVDLDGGYTGLTPSEFVKTIREEARRINLVVPVIVAVDHGGPWLKDRHRTEKWSFEKTMEAVKKSFESAISAGYDLIHVDPTVDITLSGKETISIETVAGRTLDLIEHTEAFRKENGYARIAYEVGTEEVHGGLADLDIFRRFLDLLRTGLAERGLEDVWPCFVVGKVGTDLHTTLFDSSVAEKLTGIVTEYGSVIKGHYSDNVDNPQDYPLSGMGAANVGPEFTEREYDALVELDLLEGGMYDDGLIPRKTGIRQVLWESVISSGRWKKWLQEQESPSDFYALAPERQEWLIKTGCRYIWEEDRVVAARSRLTENLRSRGVDTELIISSAIERAMDRYYEKFNLRGLNALL